MTEQQMKRLLLVSIVIILALVSTLGVYVFYKLQVLLGVYSFLLSVDYFGSLQN